MSFFEKIIEWVFVIRLGLAPTLLGSLGGTYLYFTAHTLIDEIIAFGVAIIGLILGIVLVIVVKKKETATDFMSRILASPDLDKKPGEISEKETD